VENERRKAGRIVSGKLENSNLPSAGTSTISPKSTQPRALKIHIKRSSKNRGYFLWSEHFRSGSISQSVQRRILQQP
jgi:hypothetical protein